MVEMLSYIFKSLKVSENSIKTIKTILRNQEKINLTFVIFAWVVAAYAYEQNKKIQNLDNEIKELKRMKGE
jgi:hypothetical protein